MDEVNHDSRPKRTRVLRATDVMPPFGKSILPSEDSETKAKPPQTLPPQADGKEGGAGNCFVSTGAGEAAVPLQADGVEIPTYDLAENILAEQRRAAGKRRRAPGRAEEPVAPSQGVATRMFMPEPASQDLLELQRIVAEIVARDIDRLCKRPDGPPFVMCP